MDVEKEQRGMRGCRWGENMPDPSCGRDWFKWTGRGAVNSRRAQGRAERKRRRSAAPVMVLVAAVDRRRPAKNGPRDARFTHCHSTSALPTNQNRVFFFSIHELYAASWAMNLLRRCLCCPASRSKDSHYSWIWPIDETTIEILPRPFGYIVIGLAISDASVSDIQSETPSFSAVAVVAGILSPNGQSNRKASTQILGGA